MTFITGMLYALTGAIIWGLVYNIDQRILLKTSPLTMFIVGGFMQMIVLMPYIFTVEGNKDIMSILFNKNQLFLFFISEMLLIIAGVSILYAVKHLGAPLASIFEISYPLFVALFYVILFDKTLSFKFWIGSLLIFIGSMIIIR